MADSAAFEAACACLEQSSSLNDLEARGTIRIALEEAGFVANRHAAVLGAVVRRGAARGDALGRVADPEAICRRRARARRYGAGPVSETADRFRAARRN